MLHALRYNITVSYRELEAHGRRMMILGGVAPGVIFGTKMAPIQMADTCGLRVLPSRRQSANAAVKILPKLSIKTTVSACSSALPSPDPESEPTVAFAPANVSTITPPTESYKTPNVIANNNHNNILSAAAKLDGGEKSPATHANTLKSLAAVRVVRMSRAQKMQLRPASVYGTRGEVSLTINRRTRHVSLPGQGVAAAGQHTAAARRINSLNGADNLESLVQYVRATTTLPHRHHHHHLHQLSVADTL